MAGRSMHARMAADAQYSRVANVRTLEARQAKAARKATGCASAAGRR